MKSVLVLLLSVFVFTNGRVTQAQDGIAKPGESTQEGTSSPASAQANSGQDTYKRYLSFKFACRAGTNAGGPATGHSKIIHLAPSPDDKLLTATLNKFKFSAVELPEHKVKMMISNGSDSREITLDENMGSTQTLKLVTEGTGEQLTGSMICKYQ